MSFKNYIHNLQQKPVHQRERIAVAVTLIGFFIFVGIWLLSLQEMNRSNEILAEEGSASLDDLKSNLQTGKDSIQDMMQQMPNENDLVGTDNSAPAVNNPDENTIPQIP